MNMAGPHRWRTVTLPELVGDDGVFVDGDWVESKDQDPNGDVRLIQLADICEGEFIDKSARFLTAAKAKELRCTDLVAGDILIARMPDPIGRACIFPGSEQRCVTVVDVCIVRPDPRLVDTSYLCRAVNSGTFRTGLDKYIVGTTRQRISRGNLSKVTIPLPPLAEQKRIAAVLDKADALRAKRRQALATLDTLLQSVFLDMFGDPVTNPKGWPIQTVESLLASGDGRIRTGPFGSQLLHSEFESEGVPVLGIDNVVTNEFRWAAPRCLPAAKYRKFSRYRVFPGDVLVTIMGTVGRVCIAPDDLPECMSTKHLCVFTLDQSKVLPVIIWASFLHDLSVRAQMKVAGKGAIMEGWNSTTIRQLRVKVPPLERQRDFVAIHDSIRATRQTLIAHRDVSDGLFASLQSAAFAGTLFDDDDNNRHGRCSRIFEASESVT